MIASARRAPLLSTASRSRRPKAGGVRGYDAGEKIAGRKRHLLVDTLGLIWGLKVLPAAGFVALPKCWIVERTFAWLGRYRRLSKDYESNPRNSETWIDIAMIHRMARVLLTE